MNWINILFEDGSNPYICKTEKEFKRIKRKYKLKQLTQCTYIAKEKNNE